MRKLRKVMALLVTLAMVMGLSLTAFAVERNDGKFFISGEGIDNQATVKYGLIVEEDRGSTLGWKLVEQYKEDFIKGWNSVKETNDGETDIIETMISKQWIENPANANVKGGTISPNAQLTAALENVTRAATNKLDVGEGTEVGSKGLYIVIAQSEGYSYLPMAAYMDSKDTNVGIVAKGSKDQIMKTIAESGKSVAPGDKVTYTIKHQYLYIAPNAQNRRFDITDKITNGSFDSESIEVYITNSTASDIHDQRPIQNDEYEVEETDDGFVLHLGGKYYNSENAGKMVWVVYSVTVGDVTTTRHLKNEASSSNGTGTIVETEPVSFQVKKVENEKGTVLQGAEFTIYKKVTQSTKGAVELTLEDEKIVWGLPIRGNLITNEQGIVTVDNLDAQEVYYVKETKAPDGYSLNDTAYKLDGAKVTENFLSNEEVEGVEYTKITYTYANFEDQIVEDTTLSSLPSTGGIGTTIFTIGGCVIMIAAAGMFFASRRKHGEN